ncbi:MAG TPA: alpha/beta hydrolase, partial [Steroidobacteraceae bacterium]|nr:alpha/beta hydrolase [Steroidobacteraceae bacterium]
MEEDRSVLSRAARAPDSTLTYGADADQVADLWAGPSADQARPLVLLIHGGFWRPAFDRSHLSPMAEALAAIGWTVASVEYRRRPGKPDLTVADVRRAVEVLPAKIAGHSGRALVVGHSAGGHLVLWLA